MSQPFRQVGFIGLGVMGEPMCRNLAVKSKLRIVGYDRDAQFTEFLTQETAKYARVIKTAGVKPE